MRKVEAFISVIPKSHKDGGGKRDYVSFNITIVYANQSSILAFYIIYYLFIFYYLFYFYLFISIIKKTQMYKTDNEMEEMQLKAVPKLYEYCELVDVYLLHQLQQLYGIIGLYRDDGLAIFHDPPRVVERTKKQICKIFKKNELQIMFNQS